MFDEIRRDIKKLDLKAMKEAKERWDNVAKPLSSLGSLETTIVQIAGIQRTNKINVDKSVVCVMCGDNGVVARGVTQVESEVTAIVAENMTKNESTVCIMAEAAGAKVCVVDVGMCRDLDVEGLVQEKVMYGTKDMTMGPAMTRVQALEAIHVGIQMAKRLKEEGYNLIMTGEMGIGNTTTSAAIASVMLEKDVEEVTGRGAGLCSKGLLRKIQAIKTAIEVNEPKREDPLGVLEKIGGLDIAGMVGLYIGGALEEIPVMIDGFISAVAALLARELVPECADYMLPSHCSAEPAGASLLEVLGFKPMVTCDMCLGEGTGAVAAYSVLKLGETVYKKMSSFEDANIEKYEHLK